MVFSFKPFCKYKLKDFSVDIWEHRLSDVSETANWLKFLVKPEHKNRDTAFWFDGKKCGIDFAVFYDGETA